MQSQEQTRFRSFAERYLIERANGFRRDPDDEMQDAHEAVVRAKSIYKMIDRASNTFAPETVPGLEEGELAGMQPGGIMRGATGAASPLGPLRSSPNMAPAPYDLNGLSPADRAQFDYLWRQAPNLAKDFYDHRMKQIQQAQVQAMQALANPPVIVPVLDAKSLKYKDMLGKIK